MLEHFFFLLFDLFYLCVKLGGICIKHFLWFVLDTFYAVAMALAPAFAPAFAPTLALANARAPFGPINSLICFIKFDVTIHDTRPHTNNKYLNNFIAQIKPTTRKCWRQARRVDTTHSLRPRHVRKTSRGEIAQNIFISLQYPRRCPRCTSRSNRRRCRHRHRYRRRPRRRCCCFARAAKNEKKNSARDSSWKTTRAQKKNS